MEQAFRGRQNTDDHAASRPTAEAAQSKVLPGNSPGGLVLRAPWPWTPEGAGTPAAKCVDARPVTNA